MTELLAALLGAIVGGLLSAWVGARQTAKVLKHETNLAAEERMESQRAEDYRRVRYAADQLIAALAEFTAPCGHDEDRAAVFVRMPATAEMHRARAGRATALLQVGLSHSHALPVEMRSHWDALTWLVRFCNAKVNDRSERMRRRDANDLLNYCEYVLRCLLSLDGDHPAQLNYAAPDVRRDDQRPWGFKPDDISLEPDLTAWHLESRLVGEVRFNTGEVRWYGPNGQVEDITPESNDTELSAGN